MLSYHAPLRDLRFVLQELHGLERIAALPGCEEVAPDLVEAVLGQAARFCESVLLPLNQPGDQGCRYANGEVATPAGFREAYRAYVDGGWPGLACDPAHGGQGLPEALNVAVTELICSANVAFGTYPGLTRLAYHTLAAHAPEEVKHVCLPKLASGAWCGTMCLTEPQCGTDLGLVRTKAVPIEGGPIEGGRFAVSGGKIFITAGEHDLSENILHLVLARLAGAPAGTRGLSLFLVPRFQWRDDASVAGGSLGPRNGVRCTGIEHKMGLAASATCTLEFADATGVLVGEAGRGLQAMFTMMNGARLAVGVQGLGIAETAYQSARAYARERLQGRAPGGTRRPDLPADPLIAHPDVRRMLLTMKAGIEGGRALTLWAAGGLDVARRHTDPAARQEADDLVQLLTPVIKAHLTDLGFEAANLALQIFGGHGYIREQGIEQLVRDARIAQIYEGTNGIQALDLVGRKLPQHYGRLLRRFFHPLAAELASSEGDTRLHAVAMPLAKAFGRLQRATLKLAEDGLSDADGAAASASDYLRLMALVALGLMWLRTARVAHDALARGSPDAEFYRAKLATSRFFFERMLPQTSSLFAAIMAGGGAITAVDEQAI